MCAYRGEPDLRAANPLVPLVDVEEDDLRRDLRRGGARRLRPEGELVARVAQTRHEMGQAELGVEVLGEGAVDEDGHAEAAAVLRRRRRTRDAHVALGRVPAAHRVRGGDVVVLGRLEVDVEDEALVLRRHVVGGVDEGGEEGKWE